MLGGVRASRLLSILLLLQNRGRMTAQELAEELDVSVRTVYRDVEALSTAGVPLYGDAGHHGGYQLIGGYRTRLTGLHVDEAESLALSGVPDAAAELGLGAVLAVAQSKLAAALPAELRGRVDRVRERFHLDPQGWYRPADQAPFLLPVADAVWNLRRLRVLYRRWSRPQEVERVLDPYGLVLKAGVWYFVAAERDRVLTYRVSQIRELGDTGERFERPASFDLPEYWRGYLKDYDERRFRTQATVRLRAALLRSLPERLDTAMAEAIVETATEPDADGWVTATMPVESADYTVPLLLGFGPDVEVLGPAELRDRMAETVAALQAMYASPAVDSKQA
jgi:predicted DNA-binding transcriptional regulator YafY